MNQIVTKVRFHLLSVSRMLLLFGVAVCFACFFSGCTDTPMTENDIKLSYHTGDSEQIALKVIEQVSDEEYHQAYYCENLDPGIFSEDVMYLQVSGNQYGKVTVECDEKEVLPEDGFYPISVEKNARVVITKEYSILYFWNTTYSYSFQFRAPSDATLSDISYRLEDGINTAEHTIFDFDSDTTDYVIEKRIPYDTLELVLHCVPEDENFEVTYSPSRRIFIESEEEELPITATITVSDPRGEYRETTYTVQFVVQAKSKNYKPGGTPSPEGTPIPTESPLPTPTPIEWVATDPISTPTPNPTATPTPTPTLTPTLIPTVTPSPTPTEKPHSVVVPNMVGM